MSNAIDAAREILKQYDTAGTDVGLYHASRLGMEALRELLESVAAEHRETDSRGYPFASPADEWAYMGPTIQETRYVTPWGRA